MRVSINSTGNYTTKSQSEKLIELGINPSTADIVYIKTAEGGHLMLFPEDMVDGDYVEHVVWSVGNLMDIVFNCVDIGTLYFRKDKNKIDELIKFIETAISNHMFNFLKIEN